MNPSPPENSFQICKYSSRVGDGFEIGLIQFRIFLMIDSHHNTMVWSLDGIGPVQNRTLP